MKFIKYVLVCALLTAGIPGISFARPLLIEPADVLPVGGYEITAGCFIDNFMKMNDIDGKSADFTGKESRNSLMVPFGFKFGISEGQELGISFPYLNINHTTNSASFNGSGIGDIYLLGKKVFKTSDMGVMSIGLGAKAPIGKSVFHVDADQLATGTGSWDIMLSLFSLDKRMGQMILHGYLTYAFRFNFSASKIMNQATEKLDIEPGSLITWGVGIEFPIPSTMLALLLELTGKHAGGGYVKLSSTGANINDEILAKSYPEISIHRSEELYLTPALQVSAIDSLFLTAGVRIPISVRNNYLGTSYVIGASFKFGNLTKKD